MLLLACKGGRVSASILADCASMLADCALMVSSSSRTEDSSSTDTVKTATMVSMRLGMPLAVPMQFVQGTDSRLFVSAGPTAKFVELIFSTRKGSAAFFVRKA